MIREALLKCAGLGVRRSVEKEAAAAAVSVAVAEGSRSRIHIQSLLLAFFVVVVFRFYFIFFYLFCIFLLWRSCLSCALGQFSQVLLTLRYGRVGSAMNAIDNGTNCWLNTQL